MPHLLSVLHHQPRLSNGRRHGCSPCGLAFWGREQGGEWVQRAKWQIRAQRKWFSLLADPAEKHSKATPPLTLQAGRSCPSSTLSMEPLQTPMGLCMELPVCCIDVF